MYFKIGIRKFYFMYILKIINHSDDYELQNKHGKAHIGVNRLKFYQLD